MKYQHITTPEQLSSYCEKLEKHELVGLDTEFVSEHTYSSQLCLVQLVTDEGLAIIDTVKAPDVAPLWRVLARPGVETVVHAGREEILFSRESVGTFPSHVFDTQIAAGLVCREYPGSYASLVKRFLNKKVAKGETRSDWRKRPLSENMIEYALEDVRYLFGLRERITGELAEKGRSDWLADETASWMGKVEATVGDDRWRRLPGLARLKPRALAVAREVWRWREERARERDIPSRRMLRDDLVVEIATRATDDEARIRAIRGMDQGWLGRSVGEIARCASRALALEADELPVFERGEEDGQIKVLAQFLQPALSGVCRDADLSPGLVATMQDLKDLIRFRLDNGEAEVGSGAEAPLLAGGWRAELVGELLDDLLMGRKSIRIKDPNADQPWVFEAAPTK